MKVFNENTGKFCNDFSCVRGVVYANENYIEYGYFNLKGEEILIKNSEYYIEYGISEKCCEERFIYSNEIGYFVERKDEYLDMRRSLIKGNGDFPYAFNKNYEAVDNFHIFNRKQKILNNVKYKLSDYLNYTFGIEFETTQGYIPQHICFRDGLIPLRDGSISGLEYSTVVLEGNKGLNLLHQQLQTLRKYTYFDKECALHINFGGFPLDANAIFALNCLWNKIGYILITDSIIPRLSFNTSQYKANHKDYCILNPMFENFNDLYKHYVGINYLGDLTQPHPNDIKKKAKWNIPGRYYGLNLINMLCYTSPKTVEFRFLRPSYNFNKITLWMYILNSILEYSKFLADKYGCKYKDMVKYIYNVDLSDVIIHTYGKDFYYDVLMKGIGMLKISTINQNYNNNNYGGNYTIDEDIFDDSQGILW